MKYEISEKYEKNGSGDYQAISCYNFMIETKRSDLWQNDRVLIWQDTAMSSIGA